MQSAALSVAKLRAKYRRCSHLGVFKKGMRQIRLRKQSKAIKHMCHTIARAWGIGLITYRIIKPTLMFFSTSSLLLYVHFTNISFPKTQEINIFDLLKAMLGLTFFSLSLSLHRLEQFRVLLFINDKAVMMWKMKCCEKNSLSPPFLGFLWLIKDSCKAM